MSTIPFPVRLKRLDRVCVIRLPRDVCSAKKFLRAKAKETDIYHQHITTESNTEINSVGDWLFGISGYTAHLRIAHIGDRTVQLEWPSLSPDVVHELICRVVRSIET